MIDDDPATRALVKVVAREVGWMGDFLEAATGAGAITIATETPITAAVLDIQMPVLDGVKAAEAIWNYCVALPIIFYTSELSGGPLLDRAKGIRKGEIDELADALKELFASNPECSICEPADAIVLQALLAARDDSPLMVLTLEGEFKFANLAASRLYELPYPARGSHFDELNALYEGGGSREARSLPFAQAIATGLPVQDEVRLRKRDGRVLVATVTAVPHHAVDGELTSVSLYTHADSIADGRDIAF